MSYAQGAGKRSGEVPHLSASVACATTLVNGYIRFVAKWSAIVR